MIHFIVTVIIAFALASPSSGFQGRYVSSLTRFKYSTSMSAVEVKKGEVTVNTPSSDLRAIITEGKKPSVVVNPRRFMKATKQLATLGPASNFVEMIEKLFLSGADIFRLNFSHGEHSEKAELVKMIRIVEAKYNRPIAILADLQGPKLRVGLFENDRVILVEGQKFTFDLRDELGSSYRVKMPHPEILNTLGVGDTLLLDDGKLRMRVVETTMATASTPTEGAVVCEVVIGGKLSNKKGVNTPSIVLPISPLTPKDRSDLEFIKTLDVDWVALSFVQRPEDMEEFRALAGDSLRLMAKLEKPSAIEYLDEIVKLSDGIMVARGDLGVEMSPWDVPIIQKQIVQRCRLLGKPVVIATQMMESMIENPTPTRAEASDCATAVYDLCDAVMLSAESAAGSYPVESVTMQQLVINKVETDEVFRSTLEKVVARPTEEISDLTSHAITNAVGQVAKLSKSKAIVAFSTSGGTAISVSQLRPTVPIIAACEDVKVARQLAMVWGIFPLVVGKHDQPFSVTHEIDRVSHMLCDLGFAQRDTDLLTFVVGLPWGTPGSTNMIRVTSASGTDYWFDKANPGSMKKYTQD